MAICIRLNVGKLQITSRHKEHQTKHNRHCFNRIRYHVSNYHNNCEILDPRLHAPNRAAGGYSHSERQALTALRSMGTDNFITENFSLKWPKTRVSRKCNLGDLYYRLYTDQINSPLFENEQRRDLRHLF